MDNLLRPEIVKHFQRFRKLDEDVPDEGLRKRSRSTFRNQTVQAAARTVFVIYMEFVLLGLQTVVVKADKSAVFRQDFVQDFHSKRFYPPFEASLGILCALQGCYQQRISLTSPHLRRLGRSGRFYRTPLLFPFDHLSVHFGLGFESVKLVSAGGLAILEEQLFGKLGEADRNP